MKYALIVLALILSACSDGSSDYISSASDAKMNACGELSDVAQFAMRNRQNGVSIDTQMRAAQSAAQKAVVRNVYQLPIDTSPSTAWGITQTACLKVYP